MSIDLQESIGMGMTFAAYVAAGLPEFAWTVGRVCAVGLAMVAAVGFAAYGLARLCDRIAP